MSKPSEGEIIWKPVQLDIVWTGEDRNFSSIEAAMKALDPDKITNKDIQIVGDTGKLDSKSLSIVVNEPQLEKVIKMLEANASVKSIISTDGLAAEALKSSPKNIVPESTIEPIEPTRKAPEVDHSNHVKIEIFPRGTNSIKNVMDQAIGSSKESINFMSGETKRDSISYYIDKEKDPKNYEKIIEKIKNDPNVGKYSIQEPGKEPQSFDAPKLETAVIEVKFNKKFNEENSKEIMQEAVHSASNLKYNNLGWDPQTNSLFVEVDKKDLNEFKGLLDEKIANKSPHFDSYEVGAVNGEGHISDKDKRSDLKTDIESKEKPSVETTDRKDLPTKRDTSKFTEVEKKVCKALEKGGINKFDIQKGEADKGSKVVIEAGDLYSTVETLKKAGMTPVLNEKDQALYEEQKKSHEGVKVETAPTAPESHKTPVSALKDAAATAKSEPAKSTSEPASKPEKDAVTSKEASTSTTKEASTPPKIPDKTGLSDDVKRLTDAALDKAKEATKGITKTASVDTPPTPAPTMRR